MRLVYRESDGQVLAVSFGCSVTCDGVDCIDYTEEVPSGYESLEDWYLKEADKLYRWKYTYASGSFERKVLTLNSSAVAPADESAKSAITVCPDSGWVSIPTKTDTKISMDDIITKRNNAFELSGGGVLVKKDLTALVCGNICIVGCGDEGGHTGHAAVNVNGSVASLMCHFSFRAAYLQNITLSPEVMELKAGDKVTLEIYGEADSCGSINDGYDTYLTLVEL